MRNLRSLDFLRFAEKGILSSAYLCPLVQQI